MSYITEVPGAVLSLDNTSLLNVVKIPATTALNDLNGSKEASSYIVHDDANGPETLTQGDYLAPVVDGTSMPGTYIGAGTFQNAGLTLGSMTDSGVGGLTALGIKVTVNPISGNFYSDASGKIQFISETPLSADRIMASLSVNLPLSGNLTTINVPVSELTSSLAGLDSSGALRTLLSPVLGSTLDLTQYIMDTAVLSSTTNPTATMTLEPGEFTVDPVCYLKGTRILTESGEANIEDLREGDMVVCRFGGLRPVKWIGRQRYSGKSGSEGRPIRIKAGALAENVPSRDLYVSEGHSMLVGDVLVLAKDLVNGLSVARVADGTEWQYYQLDLGIHDLILANRSWSESFADCQDFRSRFDNHAEYRLRFGDHPAPEAPQLCLERPQSGPAFYNAIASVAARALQAEGDCQHGPLEGRIESVSKPNLISGWAVDTQRRGRPIQLEILLDGVVIGETTACIPRKESVDQGRMIFEFRFPMELTSQELLRAVVRRKTDGQRVASLPSAIMGTLHGCIDLVRQDGRIEGWARDKSFPEQPTMLEVVIGEEVLGTVLACRHRADLDKVGFGDVAFSFDANRPIEAHEAGSIEIRRTRDGSTIRVSDRTRRVFDQAHVQLGKAGAA